VQISDTDPRSDISPAAQGASSSAFGRTGWAQARSGRDMKVSARHRSLEPSSGTVGHANARGLATRRLSGPGMRLHHRPTPSELGQTGRSRFERTTESEVGFGRTQSLGSTIRRARRGYS
jgi:hypothetical protein